MANTLTPLVPSLISSFQATTREHLGFVGAVNTDFDDKGASIGDTVKIPIAGTATVSDMTPAVTIPTPADSTLTNLTFSYTKQRKTSFFLTGEEERQMMEHGAGFKSHEVEEAIRALTNEIEVDVAAAARLASRAAGTAGTTPFASNTSAASAALRILNQNGAPMSNRQMVVGDAELANLQGLSVLQRVNESGGAATLREGMIGRLLGADVRYSHAVTNHTKGTGSGYLVNDASLAIGDTVIAADTGSGTILAGDIVTFAGDTDNQYVVTSALSGGSFTIGAPGLKVAIADNAAITVVANSVQNCVFDRNAIALSVRPFDLPSDDLAVQRLLVTDPFSGLTFTFAKYLGYLQAHWEVSAVWGVKNVKEANTAILLG